jgi:hypothetical protein
MKYIFVVLVIILTSSCVESRYSYIVECDTGFKTPLSSSVYIKDGFIMWEWIPHEGYANFRKIKYGETCKIKK